MQVITIANQKGGCGKTITAVNLAAAISGMDKKVLFIDLDPQSHATMALGIKITDPVESSYSIFESFINNNIADLHMLMQKKYENLWLIGSHILLGIMEQKMSNVQDAVRTLSNTLRNQTAFSAFDYTIIDTPPNLGFLTLNAISAANRLIVPLDVSLFSLNGVSLINQILDISESMSFQRPSVNFLITLFDGRSNFAKNFLQKARELLDEKLLHTIIRSNVKLRESVLFGKAIFEYMPFANGAADYTSLVYEIAPELKGRTINLKTAECPINRLPAAFKLYAPLAKNVYVAGSFNGWTASKDYALRKHEDDTWIKTIDLPEGTYYYKFIVDGQWKEDPGNSLVENDMMGGKNSVLLVKT